MANPDPEIRARATKHMCDCIDLGKELHCRAVSLWFADGTNYPGQDSIRARKHRFEYALREAHNRLAADQILLVEYKPFEPAFYQTDIADWGMAYMMAKIAGPQAKVLVDTGHHVHERAEGDHARVEPLRGSARSSQPAPPVTPYAASPSYRPTSGGGWPAFRR